MRFIISICILSITLISCSETVEVKNEVTIEKIEPTIPPEDNYDYDTLQGMYIGGFGGSDIRIILNYISKKNAIGYNIHKGLQRNITGKVTRSGDSVQLVMTEPGDNEFDGVFTINFIGNDDAPYGTWESNSGEIPKQEFKLKKVIQPDEDDFEEVTITNFSRIFNLVRDTIGNYSFNNDGLVILEYYEGEYNYEDLESLDQMKQLKGSWSLKGTHVTINWEPNKIFPNNKLELDIVEHEYGGFSLEGEGDHNLWSMYGW